MFIHDATRTQEFAAAVAARAAELGLTYLAPASLTNPLTGPLTNRGGARPIAVALPRAAERDDAVRARAAIAKAVLSALVKVGAASLRGALGPAVRASLLHGLSPLERRVLATSSAHNATPRIVTARADILIDAVGTPRVVEMNTTIPAMQGYSDIALRAWTEVFIERTARVSTSVARHLAGRALTRTGSNADDLLDALVAAYERDDGARDHPSVALAHRAGDAQLGELEYLAAQFRARGHEAHTVVFDTLTFDTDGRLRAGAFRPDIVYRHVFARLLDEEGAFALALADPVRHHVYNPVTAHLEQKAALAALSLCADDDALAARVGLDDEERLVAARHVPWTRMLSDTLVDHVARSPAGFVIKRSWDYGGKSVVLGSLEDGSWSERVHAAAREGDWVVQERVALHAHPHLVAGGAGPVEERALFVDASAYTSFGTALPAMGAVRRASVSPIVNIQSGGGVMPVVTTALLRALAALTPTTTTTLASSPRV